MKKLNEIEHFKARMNMPIGTSSFSIPIDDISGMKHTYKWCREDKTIRLWEPTTGVCSGCKKIH